MISSWRLSTEMTLFALKRIYYGPFCIISDLVADYAAVGNLFLPDPDHRLKDATFLPGRGRNCVTAVVRLAGEAYLLKKYEYRGCWYGLRHVFKRSRALRVFVNQRSAWVAGVSTPEPLVCLEKRHWGMLKECYVICRFIPESQTLDACWDTLAPREKEDILAMCGVSLGTLHRCGLTHGDSNWRNVLVTQGVDGLVPWLIDFDGSRRPLLMPDKVFRKDIGHFLRDMRWRKLTDSFIQVFVVAWQTEITRERGKN